MMLRPASSTASLCVCVRVLIARRCSSYHLGHAMTSSAAGLVPDCTLTRAYTQILAPGERGCKNVPTCACAADPAASASTAQPPLPAVRRADARRGIRRHSLANGPAAGRLIRTPRPAARSRRAGHHRWVQIFNVVNADPNVDRRGRRAGHNNHHGAHSQRGDDHRDPCPAEWC